MAGPVKLDLPAAWNGPKTAQTHQTNKVSTTTPSVVRNPHCSNDDSFETLILCFNV
jgi:hypothetical protein